MPNNRKYHKSSLYYPDDKDLFDFLASSCASVRKLRAFLFSRGICLSRTATDSDYYKYVSRLPLSWADLVELVDLIDLAEKKEKTTFSHYEYGKNFESVVEAFNAVNAERSLNEKEHYRINQKNGIVQVDVDYIEIDNGKTPMLQGRPATIRIEISEEGGRLKATHTSNDVAAAVLKSFEDQLGKIHPDENGKPSKLKSSKVSLKAVLNPKLRVQFFTTLIRGLDGLDYASTTNVRVGRMPIGDTEADSVHEENETDEDEDQRIKNVIIQGINIQDTKQYQELLDAGFFISSITWDVVDRSSSERISLTAGFRSADEGEGFEYKINYRCVPDGGGKMTHEKVLPFKIGEYNELIQKAASSSYDDIVKAIESKPTLPAKGDAV